MAADDVTEQEQKRVPQPRSLGSRLVIGGAATAAVTVPFTLLAAMVLSHSEALRDWDTSIVDALHDQVVVRPDLGRLLGWISTATHPNTVRMVTAVLVVGLWLRG